jgi:hypothetical protein
MSKTRVPEENVVEYFSHHVNPQHRQYLAMRRFFFDEATAEEVAGEFNYTVSTIYTLARNFRERLASCGDSEDPFFKTPKAGRKKMDPEGELAALIIEYRKKQLSIPDIKIILDAKGYRVSEAYIWETCKDNGFVRLPKRDKQEHQEILEQSGYTHVSTAPVSRVHDFTIFEEFFSKGVGLLCFLPIIKAYGIDEVIESSNYPSTAMIGRLNSILCFLALKLSYVERYGHDDGWCMDRGLGMFAGLNVLPKTTWYSSYSSAITRADNIAFIKALNEVWSQHGLLSDTVNLDFTAIPYWGDDDPFENNWSGKRSKALISIQAVLAQDPDKGILCYGDTTIKHDNQDGVVLEFLDFYNSKPQVGGKLKYLVFDSKFTTLENLGRLNEKGVYFLTIQRKSKTLEAYINNIKEEQWKTARIEKANHKTRLVTYAESTTTNIRYGKDQKLRQIFIKGTQIKPATILTNDFSLSAEAIIQKYARRWLVETEISEQIYFFHLNRNSSGIVVKVDFDLTMTILAHNLYRLLAMNLPGYSHNQPRTLFDKFIDNYGEITVDRAMVTVKMNRKRALPLLMETLPGVEKYIYKWIGNKQIVFVPNNHT